MTRVLAQATELELFEEHFVRLIDVDELGVAFVATAILVAFGIGAVHALGPGHGKAIIAAYLVGTRGRPRDAVALGVVVGAMHTFSVLVLGAGLYVLTRQPGSGARATPFMLLASGLLVLAVGIWLVVRQVQRRRLEAGHHHHHHGLPEGVSPLSRRGLVLLGISGGLLPSPSAFLVLATALFVDRLAFGLVLVTAFSIGLATCLTAVGLAAVHGRDLVVRRSAGNPRLARATAALPLASSVLVLAGGVYLTVRAAIQL